MSRFAGKLTEAAIYKREVRPLVLSDASKLQLHGVAVLVAVRVRVEEREAQCIFVLSWFTNAVSFEATIPRDRACSLASSRQKKEFYATELMRRC